MTSNLHNQLITEDIARVLACYPLPELTHKRLFLTGGTGFFGYWLLQTLAQLNDQGAEISVTALSRNPHAFLERYPEFRDMTWLKFVQGDVRNYIYPQEYYDFFVHGASETSPQAAQQAGLLFETLFLGTRHVLQHMLHCRAHRILVISSGAVYGEQPSDLSHITEEHKLACDSCDADDAYGEGKRVMEMLVACYAREYGLEAVYARCFAFIGYGLPPHLAAGQIIRDAVVNRQIVIKGDGKAVRSYLYAADLALWLLALLVRGRRGGVYNVGSDQASSLEELARCVADALPWIVPIEILAQTQTTKRLNYVPDVSLIKHEFGVSIWTDLKTAIQRMAEYV